jgi:hypothetical protein
MSLTSPSLPGPRAIPGNNATQRASQFVKFLEEISSLQDFILTFTLFFPYKKELRKGV